MKLLKLVLSSMLMYSLGFAADFSKYDDVELASVYGSLKGAEAVDLELEIRKRKTALSGDALKKFNATLKESYTNNTKALNKEEKKAQRDGILKALRQKVSTMTEEEKEIYGLASNGHQNSCPMHGSEGHNHNNHNNH